MSVLTLPVCPEGCGGLPASKFNDCSPELHYGRVTKVYLASADFNTTSFNSESLSSWTTAISDKNVYKFVVIGELPEPDQEEVEVSGGRTAVGLKNFTLPFIVDETNDVNYQWLLTVECNMTFKMWFETSDGMLYGGNDGIKASIVANHIIPREDTALTYIDVKAKWKAQRSPLRCLSPMF